MHGLCGFRSRRAASIRLWMVLSLTLWVSGCAPKMVTTLAPGQGSIEVRAIAVYPFQVQYDTEPTLSYQKTVDLVNATLAPHRFLVYSYGDFQLFPLDSLDVYEGRSLLSTVASESLDLNALAILKGGATLEADGAAGGNADGQEGHREGDWIRASAWVELYHFGMRQSIARAESRFALNPLNATQTDPYPELTRQVRQLAQAVLSLSLSRVNAPEPHAALPIDYYADQSTLFKVASDDTPSIARKLLSLDEVDKAAEMLRGYQYFYPDISVLQVQQLATTPGLLVTGFSDAWPQSQGLRAGDLITQVNGTRVETPHQLDRQVARAASGEPIAVVVQRDGKEVALELRHP